MAYFALSFSFTWIITLFITVLLQVQFKDQSRTNFQSLYIHTNLINNSHQFNSNLQLFKQTAFVPYVPF